MTASSTPEQGWAQKKCASTYWGSWANDFLMLGGLAYLVVAVTNSKMIFGSFLRHLDTKNMQEVSRVFCLVVGLAALYVFACRVFWPLKSKGEEVAAACECKSGKASNNSAGKLACE
jgi:uncharacterized membrane protein YuzA (DUF378 family)